MAIEKQYVDSTLETDSQEINIYKLGSDDSWYISTTIPKFARKYREDLVDGREVYNRETGTLVEIHGILDIKGVSFTHKRDLSDEERQALRDRMNQMRSKKLLQN